MEDATIKKIVISTPSIVGKDGVGAVVGIANNSSIEMCAVVNGTIEGESVGGVVGEASNSIIASCYNTTDVIGYESDAGGVVGDCRQSSIIACYNTGDISGTSMTTGGVVGTLNASILVACYSTGSVSQTNSDGSQIGYLIGVAYNSTANNCYYIDQSDDDASGGVGDWGLSNDSNILDITNSGYLSVLNSTSTIDSMNGAIQSADYSNIQYTAGDSDVVYHPSLMGEKIVYLGKGTIYTTISTAEELANISSNRDGNYILVNDIDLTTYLSGSSWTPIGTGSSDSFRGVFDGGGKTISGLHINAEGNYQGLFGYLYGATIRNVIIDEPEIICSGTGQYIGAVTGLAFYYSTVENCSVLNGSVTGVKYVGGVIGDLSISSATNCYNSSSVFSDDFVGGVIGMFAASDASYCVNEGDVNGQNSSNNGGIGGVIGYITTSSSYSGYSNIIACYNTGSVKCTKSGTVYRDYVGGIVGKSYSANVKACYNVGEISGDGMYIGGIVGSSSGSKYTSCYNIGSVLCGEEYESNAGAIVGYAYASSSFTSCYYIIHPQSVISSWIGYNYSSSGTAIDAKYVEGLNNYVSTMNDAAGEEYFTAGDPTNTNLPHLMGENLEYTGN